MRLRDTRLADFGHLGRFVFPSRCPGCGQTANPVCADCATTMRPAIVSPPPVGIAQWHSRFSYEGVVRELVARAKYRKERHAIRWLAGAAVSHVERRDATLSRSIKCGAAVLTWIPTTDQRRRSRGFDHAQLIANSLASGFGVVRPVGLLRRADATAQTGRSREDRFRGPSFAVPYANLSSWSSTSVVLCDDVCTTGSTLRNAALALRREGFRGEIAAITVATTPPHSRSVV